MSEPSGSQTRRADGQALFEAFIEVPGVAFAAYAQYCLGFVAEFYGVRIWAADSIELPLNASDAAIEGASLASPALINLLTD